MICFVGTAPFMIQLTNGFMQTIVNKSLVLYGGDIAVSAMGATIAVTSLLFMPVIGLCEGAQPVVSFNLGAKKYDRVLKIYKTELIIALLLFTFSCILLQLFSDRIIRIFNKDDFELIAIGTQSMKIISSLYPFIALPMVTIFLLQATKCPKTAAFLSLSRQMLFVIPAIMILPRHFGLVGVFYAFPTADFLGFLTALPVAVWQLKKYSILAKEHNETTVQTDFSAER